MFSARPAGPIRVAMMVAVILVGAVASHAQHIFVFQAAAPADSEWAGDIDVGAQAMSASGKTAWLADQFTGISTGTYMEQHPVAVSDGAGGAIVVMEAAAREGDFAGDWEIVAQRVDRDGKLMWDAGQSSWVANTTWHERNPIAISDGAGGAFVFYEAYGPPGTEWAGDVDIRGQHISSTGQRLWGDDGVGVHTTAAVEQAPCAISDGAGGAIVVCQAAEREGQYAGDWEILAQRVGSDGALAWHDGESPTVASSSTWAETRPVAVTDGAGGALIFFQAAGPAGEYAGEVDIRGQRLSATGDLLWEGGESSIEVSSSSALEQAPTAVPDGAGGALVIFELIPRDGDDAGRSMIFGQRVSGDGTLLWNNGEKSSPVESTDWSSRSPCALPDGAGGAFVAFEAHGLRGTQYGGDVDIYAQRVSAAGERRWSGEGENSPCGVSISSGYLEQSPCMASDGAGGVLIGFEAVARTGQYLGDYEIAAQRLGPDGKLLWNGGDAVFVANSTWSERWPVMPGGVASGLSREGHDNTSPPGGATGPSTPGVNRVNPANP